MQKTATLYHNPTQGILHVVVAEVDETTGAHTVVDSKVESVPNRFDITRAASFYEQAGMLTRSYRCTEVPRV